MKPIEKDLMTGMISILHQAIESKQCGMPIMDDGHIDTRLADLKEFEDETGVMFINSPNCKVDLKSMVNIKAINNDNLKECEEISEIVEYANSKEMIVYLDVVGLDMIVTYTNGCLTSIQTNDKYIEKKIPSLNLPYKIKKDGDYIVKGKIIFSDKPIFYVNDIRKGGSDNLKNDLNEAKALDFDVVPFWLANNLKPKKLKDAVDYVINYGADENLDCNGVVFKFNEKKFNNVLNFGGCYYNTDNNK